MSQLILFQWLKKWAGNFKKENMYYLDTSALRVLSKDLPELKAHPVYISVLGLIEIISRVRHSEQDFTRCKSTLSSILKSGIKVDHRMPDQVLLSGFDLINKKYDFKEFRVDCLNKIIALTQECTSLEDFIKKEKILSEAIKHPLEYFEIYDKSFGENFSQSFDSETKIIREAFDRVKSGLEIDTIVPKEVLNGSFPDFCVWFLDTQELINESATVFALAQRAVSDLTGFGHSAESQDEIYESYNGKTSAFVAAYSRLTMYVHKNGGRPGRNDPLDMAHFLYIGEGSILISNDKKMLQISNEIKCPAYDSSGLKEKFSIRKI
ncbi:hypothetical protein K2X05_00805 [bacterium]|nr:hypothetical protein [bacterium]